MEAIKPNDPIIKSVYFNNFIFNNTYVHYISSWFICFVTKFIQKTIKRSTPQPTLH